MLQYKNSNLCQHKYRRRHKAFIPVQRKQVSYVEANSRKPSV